MMLRFLSSRHLHFFFRFSLYLSCHYVLMDFPTIDDEYEAAKQKAKLFYKDIGEVWCPALNDYVAFNEIGFSHLMKKGLAPRPKSEQRRRFALLFYVENILSTSSPSVTDLTTNGRRKVRYWKFTDYQNGNTVKIIIRQTEGKHKHFLSVYGKIKNPRPRA